MTLTDTSAEATVLAAALAQPDLIGHIAALDPGVFSIPMHQMIHSALLACHQAGEPRDHATVARRAAQEAVNDLQARAVSKAIVDMMGRGQDYAVGFYLDRIRNLHTARQVADAGQRLIEAATEAAHLEDTELLEASIGRAHDDLAAVHTTTDATTADLPMSLDELLGKKFEHNWLIPDLFERTDRLILTGFEGTGKSILVAQMVMTIAAGLHPFLGSPMTDHNQVLVIDAENSERQTGRRYRMIRDRITNLCRKHHVDVPDWSTMVRFVIRPEGIALNDPRIVKRIERAIAATQPVFVAMGPLYRLHKLDTRDEQAAKELTDTIDRLRVKYGFAIVCEAHVAHGQAGTQRLLRPTGSSLFLRWPEFGLGLRPSTGTEQEQHPSQVDLTTWRGGREERMFPRHLHHGSADTHLPWMNGDEFYEHRARQMGYAL